jgi:4-hydroxybenzoate polyprenyltransferase
MQSANIKSNHPLKFIYNAHEKVASWVTSLAHVLESPRLSLLTVFATYFSYLLIRNLLESFSQRTNFFLDFGSQELIGDLAHFDASFTVVALMLTLILHYIAKVPVKDVIKVVCGSFILIWLAPIIDIIVTRGQGANVGYFEPEENISLLAAYLTYCGDFIGATLGIKIEVAIGLVGIYFYTFVKTRDVLSGLMASWVSYTALFIWGASPFVIKLIMQSSGLHYYYSGIHLLRYFLVINFILATWLVYVADKKRFIEFIKTIPVLKVLHYEAMFLFGICVGINASLYTLKNQYFSHPVLVGNGILLMLAIFFAMLSVTATSDLIDAEIEKKSMFNAATYRTLAWTFLACALMYASIVGIHGVFIISCVVAMYYLYLAYPLRLKRVPVLSKLVISGSSLALMLLGFWFVTGNMSGFPKLLYPIVLCVFTLVANFFDLKEGVEAVGVKTLPIIFGMKMAQWFCAAAFLIAYVSLYFVFHLQGLSVLLVAAGLLQIYFLTKKHYQELPVFLVYLGSVFLLMAHIIGLSYS